MLISTTDRLDGYKIVKYHGVVTSHIVEGVNKLKEFGSGFTDVLGGRSNIYEKVLGKADGAALKSLMDQAREAGANAVIGVDIDYATIELKGSMIVVVASGTAVSVMPLEGDSPGGKMLEDRPPMQSSGSAGDAALAAALERHRQEQSSAHSERDQSPAQSERYEVREIGADFDHDR